MDDNYLLSSSDHKTNLNDFIDYLKNKNLYNYSDYCSLHEWSVRNKRLFWKSIWDFTKINGKYNEPVIEGEQNFIKSIFFKNSELNFTSNLINRNDDNDALVFYSEQRNSRRISKYGIIIYIIQTSFYRKKRSYFP